MVVYLSSLLYKLKAKRQRSLEIFLDRLLMHVTPSVINDHWWSNWYFSLVFQGRVYQITFWGKFCRFFIMDLVLICLKTYTVAGLQQVIHPSQPIRLLSYHACSASDDLFSIYILQCKCIRFLTHYKHKTKPPQLTPSVFLKHRFECAFTWPVFLASYYWPPTKV